MRLAKEKEREDNELIILKLNVKLKTWQVKTFWLIFGFGLFGGIYSTVDFIGHLTTKEDSRQEQTPKVETVLEQSRPHILTLGKKRTVFQFLPIPNQKNNIFHLFIICK